MLDFSRPDKPTDNSFIGSCNGKFQAECLNVHWFLTLDDARQKLEYWRRGHNEVRSHSAIDNKVPISLMNGSSASHPHDPKLGKPSSRAAQNQTARQKTSRL